MCVAIDEAGCTAPPRASIDRLALNRLQYPVSGHADDPRALDRDRTIRKYVRLASIDRIWPWVISRSQVLGFEPALAGDFRSAMELSCSILTLGSGPAQRIEPFSRSQHPLI